MEALVEVKKLEGKHRLVLVGTETIALNRKGTPRDGGGHINAASVMRQAGYINDAIRKKNKQKT